MPRKNKKPKTSNEPKPKAEAENDDNSKATPSDDPAGEKPEKKGLLLSLDKKLKLQVKKEKKKQRKREFEAGNKKIPEEVSMIPKVEWETTEELQQATTARGTIVEDAVHVTEVDVLDDAAGSSEMSEEEEKNLREFLRSLEIVESGGKEKRGSDKKVEGKFHIETIPEDLFEEFMENEEKVQTREARRTFPRTSPLHSPTTRRREQPAKAIVQSLQSPPKVFYNSQTTAEDVEDGIVVINTFRSPEREVYFRRLDVILEESSDLSDASGGHPEKRRKVDSKTLPQSREDGAVVIGDRIQPVEKMSEDALKIESAESVFDVDGKFCREVEIVNLDDEDDDDGEMTERKDDREKSVSSRSKEGTESWRSSSINPDGADADVESELESQRTYIYGDDISVNDSEGVEIFITDFKMVDTSKRPVPNGKVNVKEIAEAIKTDMDKILLSKVKMIKETETKNNSSNESSSYENVPKREKVARDVRTVLELRQNPEALCNLAEKKVLTLPYGRFILKKIGLSSCCSKDPENSKEEDAYEKSPEPRERPKPPEEKTEKAYIEFDYSNPNVGETEKWYGMRTMLPEVLVGLSPSQKKIYEEKQKKWLSDEAEAASLLDLHKKFLERRCYHETNPWELERNVVYDSTAPEKNVSITEIREFERPPERSVGNANNSGSTKEEGETNTRTDSEAVGNSRLLAILQNAISDEFVPELNPSVKSSGENHEFSVVKEKKITMDGSDGFGQEDESVRQEDESSRKEQKTFRDLWNKERRYCSTENGRTKAGFRPKTICCGKELSVNEPKFVKVRAAPRKTFGEVEKEDTVITENLPAVSDIIRSFETPRVRQQHVVIDRKNRKMEISIDNEKYEISRKGDIAVIRNETAEGKKKVKEKRRSMPATLSEKEIFKQRMYDEYMSKLAERIERRQQKVIKVSRSNEIECPEETKFHDLENEFISRVKERKEKLGMAEDGKELLESLKKRCREFRNYWESEISSMESEGTSLREECFGTESTNSKRSSIQLLDTSSDLENLPKHLQELLQVEGEFFEGKPFENMPSSVVFSPTFKATAPRPGVWSPAQAVSENKTEEREENEERKKLENEPIPPVWTPKSAQASPVLERKEFRPVNFESPTLPRKKYIQDDKKESSVPPPWQQPGGDKPPQIAKSPSSPALSLPKAPNPTVTLLQKAREGHLPRGAHYLNSEMNDSPLPVSDGATIERLEIVSSARSEPERVRKTESVPKKIIGIGPTTKEGIPLVLRSEVTGENRERWYKRMYDSLHKYGNDDDYVTVKYRTSPRRKGLYNYQQGSSSGYQSEPESLSYDLSRNNYVTLDRRRREKSKENECINVTLPRSKDSPPRRDFREYKNQPGRIEDYEPGHSSISEIEANKWWDEVLEIFDKEEGKTRPTVRKIQSPRSFTNYASGYISDPQYVYKRTEDELQSPPSSEEQKEAYRIIQKGGEIPLKGLRKPAPERPKDSFNTEIEYFPLSSTLTRIRVHKQNITPLSELPLYFHSGPALNYQTLPFGVCSSFSQVQLFHPHLPPPPVVFPPAEKDQKFSVQLQNISGGEDYVQIVPQPRNLTKKSPIYANVPVIERSCSPETPKAKTGGLVSSKSVEKSGQATFSDLKRTAPSVNSDVISKISKIPTRRKTPDKAKEISKKKETIVSRVTAKKTSTGRKEKSPIEQKKEKRTVAEVKKTKIESEKPKSSKRLKTISENLRKRKAGTKKEGKNSEDVLQYLTRFVEGSGESYVDLKEVKTVSEDDGMSPIYESVEEKPKVESDMTEVFRSRSFSPDVKRKMFKFPDLNKPVPPKRKESKSPTWKMWSKMMVSYPRHRSRLDTFDSNVKFLGERIKRKLTDEKKPEFGDDVETVRTVKKDKNGDMSIKTNRYVRLTRPRATYPDVERKKSLSSPQKFGSVDSVAKKPNTVLRSSTTYSVRNPREEEDKRKSVKVTVAISSKGKDLSRKTPGATPKVQKSSPSPSLSSGKSDRASVSSRIASPSFSSPRSTSPGSSIVRTKNAKVKKPVVPTSKPEVRKIVPKQAGKFKKPEKIVCKKCPENEDEVKKGRDLVRTDSFFQNLFLRGPIEKRALREIEKPASTVLEKARRYQNQINWPETYKSEPSLSLVTYYLSQKRPVSFSRFRNRDSSPLGSFHSESFQSKLRRFDSMSEFGEEPKERSNSEPPLQRSRSDSLEQKSTSSVRSSPNSSRSPSCRRIQSYRKYVTRARSEPRTSLQCGDLGKSSSSLNLSNVSDHTEYQAYVLELMHSSRKCERFRELHKFYSNLERMGKLEKTASTGDLRPRLRNEEIIDFDRWKKVRAKERAEAELKTLVDSLVKVQKEKDLLFRTADVEAVRWKGDSGLRIKERSVDDLKEQFSKHEDDVWRKDAELQKDNYKSLWRGSSIVDVASNLNNTLVSHRGRPLTLQDLERLEKSKARIGREYGYSLKAWSSLSNEQINALRDQLTEIYDSKRRYHDEDVPPSQEKYEVFVPDSEARSSGENSLNVRCSSALSKSQTFTPTVKRKEEMRKEWKKADSIGALPTAEGAALPQLPWKDETKPGRSHSEGRTGKHDRYPVLRSKSASSSKPLSEIEKKRLSMTLSKEVIEKMAKTAGKGPVFPRETLGAIAAAGSNLRKLSEEEADVKNESGSGSSETSVKTVIRKNSMDVLKKVQYFEELQQSGEEVVGFEETKDNRKDEKKKKNVLVSSSSMENLDDYFGQQKQYATAKSDRSLVPRNDDFYIPPLRYYSTSPLRSSNDSLFSYRSRSVSPDPTKYYRAYLRMVKCGAVRKLCNKFESWEDLLSLSSDRDFWLPPPPRRFASDPELTRDLLRRFGTDPTKVTVRGQEVGDVRWLRTKFENAARGRCRARKQLVRSPITLADRFMPRINVISKTAELQLQGGKKDEKSDLPSPDGYRSLIDYTKDHGGYYYTGEVEKLRRKFERLQEAERLSILGQMYTSTPDVNELRDIAPYLECSWIAHRYPGVTRTVASPPPKKTTPKPRPRSSSPTRPKRPSSILKPSQPSQQTDQKYDPSIHRPRFRYQPEREAERRYKRGDPDWWRHWTKPTVTFKETVSFKPEPEIRDLRPESPRKYVESEVTIHYKSPVRSEAKAALSEDELARRQAESMKRIYKEERRRKYLQELQDMNSRRHTDNFIPSQKSPIALNRYDDFPIDTTAYYRREYATDPVLVARGLYDFVGRRPRELGFRRGDIIFIIRKLDKNWCEGELNGVVGLFPLSYVEVIPYNEINLKYGRARAKYDFIPQTSLELLAHKGDMITLLRKIDENWFEGRIGDRTGIIPASYCHVLAMPQTSRIPVRIEKTVSKPVAAPAAHSLIHNGSGLSSKHYYTPHLSPSSPGRSTASSASANYHDGHHSADMLIDEALMQLDEEFDLKRPPKPATQPLNVRINPRPEPELYQVLFNHVPNNDDELELIQGDTVTVVEKCGDGWYIGSKSDGKLGIFPGTHVRRIAPEFV